MGTFRQIFYTMHIFALISIKFPFKRYIALYGFETKIFLPKTADISSHGTSDVSPLKFLMRILC